MQLDKLRIVIWCALLLLLIAIELVWLDYYLEPLYHQFSSAPEERVGGWLLIMGTVLFFLGGLPVISQLRGRWAIFTMSAALSIFLFILAYAVLVRW